MIQLISSMSIVNFFTSRPHLLKHAIKSSVAVIMTVLLYRYFNLPKGYWAVVTCIVIMQSNIDTGSLELTVKLGLQRLVGTVSGACVGFSLIYLMGPNQLWLLVFIVLLTMLGSYLTLLYKGFNLFAPTAIVVILLTHQRPFTESLAFYRTIEIIIGVIVAIIVTIVLWPYRVNDYLEDNYQKRRVVLKKQYEELLEMLPTGRVSEKWFENNSQLEQAINADRQYLQHMSSLNSALKERILLASHVEAQLVGELKKMSVSAPDIPVSFLTESDLINILSASIQLVINALSISISNVSSKQANVVIHEVRRGRNHLVTAFDQFRQKRKTATGAIYSLDESYAMFVFVQSMLRSLTVCEESVESQRIGVNSLEEIV